MERIFFQEEQKAKSGLKFADKNVDDNFTLDDPFVMEISNVVATKRKTRNEKKNLNKELELWLE
jgi:hypothetical protein